MSGRHVQNIIRCHITFRVASSLVPEEHLPVTVYNYTSHAAWQTAPMYFMSNQANMQRATVSAVWPKRLLQWVLVLMPEF